MHQLPWPFGFGVLRSALVMALKSGIHIVSGAHIVSTVSETLKYINEISHSKKG